MFRKTIRDIKHHFASFFSIFLLAALSMSLFITFEGHVLSQELRRFQFHKESHLSDLWVYSEKFTEENLEDIQALSFVKNAQLRTYIKASTANYPKVQVDCYFEKEDTVNKPYLIKGEAFNPKDCEGIWISNAFAKKRHLKIGDSFTISYNGISMSKTIKGLVESCEYEFRQADNDADMYIENIAIVYLSYDAFPVRDYIDHLIDQGKITTKDLQSYTSFDLSNMDASMLKKMVDNCSDEQLHSFLPWTQMVIQSKDGKGLDYEAKIKKTLGKDYSVMVDRDSIPGLARLDSELQQHQSFSYGFVCIFMGIALLVIATTMNRIVENERIVIGTLAAMGMRKGKIVFHYMCFSLIVTILGVLLGLFLGMKYGCPYFMDLFAKWYIVPGLKPVFHPIYLILSIGIVAISALASFLSLRKILKISPSQALRPKAPLKGKMCFFEKFKFWEKLSFSCQYNLRDATRAKLRSLMCIVGTAIGMIMMLYGVGCTHLVETMEAVTFDQVQPAQYQVNLSEDISSEQRENLVKELDGELVYNQAIEVSKKQNPSRSNRKKQNLTVLDGKQLYNVVDLKNKAMDLKKGTVAVSRKLSEDLGIQIGDTIYWHLYDKNTWYQAKVACIYRSSETQGITYLSSDYKKLNADYRPTTLMTNTNPKAYANESYVESIQSKKALKKAYEKSMESVSMLVYLMLIFAIILIVVVLYNSGSLSFNEREKEFATLKVLGFRSSAIRKILSAQNFCLSIIGILIGAPLGKASLNAMMNSNGDNFDYALSLAWSDYLFASVLVLMVSMFVGFLFNKRIRKIDLVATLKGNE